MIENVLQLSRRDPGKPRAIPLTAWLRDFISEQEQDHELPPGVFSLQVEPESINIIADPGQLRQIVTNLCNNAREHASREQPLRIRIIGGKVTEFDDPVVDIIDNGPGYPAARWHGRSSNPSTLPTTKVPAWAFILPRN